MNSTKTAVVPAAKTSANSTAEKTDSKIVTLKPEQTPDLTSLDGRLRRLNQLVELRGKYERLKLSEQKLSSFEIKKGEENITLTIEDESSRDVDFSTSNPVVIKEVLDFIRTTIQNKRKEIEPQLTW